MFCPIGVQAAPVAAAFQQQDTTQQRDTTRLPQEPPLRDAVGDLNAEAVEAGEFPGAILLPGTKVSLGIGGFIKTIAIADSRLEVSGADLRPESIGTVRPDRDGNFSVDATLSRFYFDARAPTPKGYIRGYLEWDLNNGNNGVLALKPRHVYATWSAGTHTLLAGHTWTTFMNAVVVPQGLTEATVSGLLFTRQAQLRWTHRVAQPLDYEVAVESPATGDFLFESGAVARTRWPDVVGAVDWKPKETVGLRATGLVRWVSTGSGDTASRATGWGASLSGNVQISTRDLILVSGAYGKGISRYMLGMGASASGIVDADTLYLRENYGGFVSYRHDWSDVTRSTAALGYAGADPLDAQPDDAFRSTTYAFINLMWSPITYLTGGVEYAYGLLELKDGTTRGNHRLAVGVQIF